VNGNELQETYRGVVYPWHCDHVGHMSVMWYVGKFDEATWQLFSMMGVTPAYMRENQRGMVAVEQKVAYKKELWAGDVLNIRSGILEIREKMVRFCHEMRNQVSREVVATTSLKSVHIDTRTRKTCPFPTEIINRGCQMVVFYEPEGLSI